MDIGSSDSYIRSELAIALDMPHKIINSSAIIMGMELVSAVLLFVQGWFGKSNNIDLVLTWEL